MERRMKATGKAEATEEEKEIQAREGWAETHEQINDVYTAGNNDVSFLRDGEDQRES